MNEASGGGRLKLLKIYERKTDKFTLSGFVFCVSKS